MEKILIISIILVLAVLFTITIMYDINHPNLDYEWEYIQSDDSEISIMVEDTIYKEFVTYDVWKPANIYNRTRIGKNLYSLSGEDLGTFLIIDKPLIWFEEVLLIKDGVNVPKFGSKNVHTLNFSVFAKTDSGEVTYFNSTRSRDAIITLFERMYWYEYIDTDIAYNPKTSTTIAEIVFLNDDINAIEVSYQILAIIDEYYIRIGNGFNGFLYAEISKELLSDIAGINMPEAEVIVDMDNDEMYEYFMLNSKD